MNPTAIANLAGRRGTPASPAHARATATFVLAAAAMSILASAASVSADSAPPAQVSAPAAPAGASDAAAAFDTMFGAELARVVSTPDAADDAALAGRLLDAARAPAISPALLAMLCEKAYELGIKHPDGTAAAVGAMTLLAQSAPEKKDACREKIIAAHQAQYQRSRGSDKVKAAQALLEAIVRFADEKTESRDFEGAANLYRRAMSLAPTIRTANRDELQAKLEFATTRAGFVSQIARLQADLRANPKDQAARDEIVRLYVVEFDDPAAAAQALNLDAADLTAKYVLLAGMNPDRLPERALAELGHWYRGLADRSSARGRLIALGRAQGYYERFLEVHTADDAAHADVAKALADVDAALGKTAVALTKVTVLRDAEFNAEFRRRFPPSENLAGGGVASASTSYGGRRPEDVLRGRRSGTAWTPNGPAGWFEARWTPPVRGRYVLVFARDGTPGSDAWGDATLSVNGGKPQRIDNMTSGKTMIVDIGYTVPITSLRIEIKGTTYPGLAGIEIHRRMASGPGMMAETGEQPARPGAPYAPASPVAPAQPTSPDAAPPPNATG